MTPLSNSNRYGLPRWVKWLVALVPISGAAAGAARVAGGVETKAHAESTYVSKSDFAVHQSGENARHGIDSVNYLNDLREVRRALANLDSTDRCRRGISKYCR